MDEVWPLNTKSMSSQQCCVFLFDSHPKTKVVAVGGRSLSARSIWCVHGGMSSHFMISLLLPPTQRLAGHTHRSGLRPFGRQQWSLYQSVSSCSLWPLWRRRIFKTGHHFQNIVWWFNVHVLNTVIVSLHALRTAHIWWLELFLLKSTLSVSY